MPGEIFTSKSSIAQLKGVGKKRAELYQKLGLNTVGELLYFYPRAYIDFTDVKPVLQCPDQSPCCVKVTILRKKPVQRIRKGMTIYRVIAADDTSSITLTFFNNPYAYDALIEGGEVLLYGKFTTAYGRRDMNAPIILPADSSSAMKPIYHLTAGLTSNMISANLRQALTIIDQNTADYLPAELREKFGISHISFALQQIHFPKDPYHLTLARKRFAFEELLILQLALSRLRDQNRSGISCRMQPTDMNRFYKELPFSPTGAQQRAIEDCCADLCSERPMNRLIQGDVGSGKTLVAAAAAYFAAQSGWQTALMAPTEILAQQHYETLNKLLSPLGVRIGLLTGAVKGTARKLLLQQLQQGEIDLLVGTHALLTEQVKFAQLGLVVTDEQHRFGVSQRAILNEKGNSPHTMIMSATPIPRTLSLILYGDLDLSVIDELPPGRQPIETYLIPESKRERAIGFLEKQLAEGRQGYVICPLIDQDEENPGDMLSVEECAALLQKQLPYRRIGILHGKMKPADKEAIMQQFVRHELDLLVSTTVIEVGVDVPNSTIIMIENSDRFGLAQLHQLRGRVGRGTHQSYCILITGTNIPEALQRLKVLCSCSDGFEIAQQDLKLRGAGDLIGVRQHGLPQMNLAAMQPDAESIAQSQQAVNQLLTEDPQLTLPKHRFLRAKVNKMLQDVAGN